jgi:hypothetical protein
MSSDEETAFQEHLETCKVCRAYVNTIRRLSCLVADEELAYTGEFAGRIPAAGKKIRLRTLASIAAGIMLVAGISLYVGNRDKPDETYINTRSKADKAEMRTEMLFPDKETTRLFADQPAIFLWNQEVEYRLVIRYGDKIIVEAEGYGKYYIPDAKLLTGLTEFEWQLNAGDREFKGIIYLIK